MRIVVTGSLGHIGKPLTTELIAQGHSVTVISSNPEKQQEIEAIGATAAIGSLEDADFLTAVFTGGDAVFAMVPPSFREVDQVAYYNRIAGNYKKAIQQSGIKHVVLLSSYGAHLTANTGFILGAHYAENSLNELPDISLVCLRPGYFYYNLFGFTAMIKQAGFIGANYGGNDKLVLVAPKDIATVAAQELTKPAAGKTIRYIASDERTATEVAQVLGTAIGKPDLTWMVLTDDQMKEGMERQGMPAHLIANFVELGGSLHSGALVEDYEHHKPTEFGAVKLEEFAKEFAQAFNN